MRTPTTQTSDEIAAPAASNAVVANIATTATSSASSASVVTSSVTTSSSPKRTISVGEYHEKARSKPTYANETLFDGMEDLDMEEGEEERGSSSSGRNEASVGTRRPREDDSDASSSKRSRSGSDRPLADAGALSTPRGGGDDGSTPSVAVTSRTNPVRDPWMPSPSEIRSRYGNTSPLGQYALYSCSAIHTETPTCLLRDAHDTESSALPIVGLSLCQSACRLAISCSPRRLTAARAACLYPRRVCRRIRPSHKLTLLLSLGCG
ncbi:hypothetical protein PF010_g26638 [Phytophthora fragariae]|uniref:Uncharacterized protein n=1 Tax=Phytophthora fragariae TaxID=53985 RepID=A0A6G0JWS1_9STRA|nr:hypothetical protein PF003_g26649 [Phytophthora fragariae]KAE9069511.1 hypothetical protein PF010_g26638 [Phytophthora fragariae]